MTSGVFKLKGFGNFLILIWRSPLLHAQLRGKPCLLINRVTLLSLDMELNVSKIGVNAGVAQLVEQQPSKL